MNNPAIQMLRDCPIAYSGKVFTAQGAAIKTAILLLLVAASFVYTWNIATAGFSAGFAPVQGKVPDAIDIPPEAMNYAIFGMIGGLVVGFTIIFNMSTAPFLAPIYAILEGLTLGAISAGFEAKYPGIVFEAIFGTMGAAFAMTVAYSTGFIKPTQKFVTGLLTVTGGILILYTADIIAGFFGTYIGILHGNSIWSIALQFGIVAVASLFLILDFESVREAADGQAPKWMEWYAAFSILVTVVWIYLEVLKLLAKLKSNDD